MNIDNKNDKGRASIYQTFDCRENPTLGLKRTAIRVEVKVPHSTCHAKALDVRMNIVNKIGISSVESSLRCSFIENSLS